MLSIFGNAALTSEAHAVKIILTTAAHQTSTASQPQEGDLEEESKTLLAQLLKDF